MVAAYKKAKSPEHTDYDEKNFRTFLFNFANTFFREICSLYLTFLTEGRTVKLCNKDEFGQDMESVLFGGDMIYQRDRERDDSQVRLLNNPLQKLVTSRRDVC